MLLFERCGEPGHTRNSQTPSQRMRKEGRRSLQNGKKSAHKEKRSTCKSLGTTPFTREWLALPPRLADKDLRGVLYVSREHAPLITPEDRLSSEGAELLEALLAQPDMAAELKVRLEKIARAEIGGDHGSPSRDRASTTGMGRAADPGCLPRRRAMST